MMPLHEIDVLGIFVTPAVPCFLLAVGLSLVLRRLLDRTPINRFVWNRALFDFSVMVATAAVLVLSLRFGRA